MKVILSKLDFNSLKFKFTFKNILLFFICFFLLLFYGTFFETSAELEKETVLIKDKNYKVWKGTKIAFLSDLTLQDKSLDNIENIISKVNSNSPDFLIISGYFFDSNTKVLEKINYDKIISLFKSIKAPFGKFAFLDDLNKDADTRTQIGDILEKSEFQLLEQNTRTIYKRDLSYPLKLLMISKDNNLITCENNTDKYLLLTSNNEANAPKKCDNDNVILALTYGNYGGIIGIPFIKNFISNLNYSWKKNILSADTKYINSSGVGTPNNIGFRLFNHAKAYLLELQTDN